MQKQEMETAKVIAKNLKAAREVMAMSQEELEHRAGVGIKTIRNVESEEGNPQVSTLEFLAIALGVSVKYLVTPRDTQNNENPGIVILLDKILLLSPEDLARVLPILISLVDLFVK